MKYGDGTMRKIRQGGPSIQSISSIPLGMSIRLANKDTISEFNENATSKPIQSQKNSITQTEVKKEILTYSTKDEAKIQNSDQNAISKNTKAKILAGVKSFIAGSVVGSIGMISYFQPNLFPFAVGAGIGVLNAAIDIVASERVAKIKNAFGVGMIIGTVTAGAATGIVIGLISGIICAVRKEYRTVN